MSRLFLLYGNDIAMRRNADGPDSETASKNRRKRETAEKVLPVLAICE